MNYVYIDISGTIDFKDPNQKLCVIGLVSCPDPRLPQLILKPPHNPHPQVARYFAQYGEYKFSAMKRDKHRVRELLMEVLKDIAKEPGLTLQTEIINRKELIDFSSCILLDSNTPKDGKMKVMADKGSLEKFDYFFRVISESQKQTCVGFSEGQPDLKKLAEQTKMFNPTSLSIPIDHKSSIEIKGIQIADLIAGAVFQKEARNDETWYEIIKDKVKIRGSV